MFDSNRAANSDAVLFYGLMALLVIAPLFRGGYPPLPLLLLELMALVLLLWQFWRPPLQGRPLSPTLSLFLALLFLLPLAQLLAVPFTLWAALPGRSFYALALEQVGMSRSEFGWRAISLIPAQTESAFLTIVPPLAVFLATVHLDSRRLLLLVWIFLGIATTQALLGLIQYGDGSDSLFRFGNTVTGDHSASGTYINRNHLAGLLEMALPLGLALLAATIGHSRPPHASGSGGRRGRTFRQWLARFSVARLNQTAIYSVMAMAILLGLIFTRSRTGVSLAMLGILLSMVMFSNRLGGRNAYGLIGTFTAVGIGLASLIGLAPVWSRFTVQDPFEDGRWKIFDATLQAIGEFFPLGSGAGTFESVMRRFHPVDFPGVTIGHAHNDYLEWLLEFGLIAGLLIVTWLILYLRQWGRVWKRGEWTPFRFVQAGAGIALMLMMLHTLVDFNLRTPANVIFTAFLAALFFNRPLEEERGNHRQRETSAHKNKPPPVAPIPPQNQVNPFAPSTKSPQSNTPPHVSP